MPAVSPNSGADPGIPICHDNRVDRVAPVLQSKGVFSLFKKILNGSRLCMWVGVTFSFSFYFWSLCVRAPPFVCEYFNMNESIKFWIRKIVCKGCCYRNLKFLQRFSYIKISLVLLCCYSILIITGVYNLVKYFHVLLMQNAESSLKSVGWWI